MAETPALPHDAFDRVKRAWGRALVQAALRGDPWPGPLSNGTPDYVYWDEPPPELFRLTSWPVRLALVTP